MCLRAFTRLINKTNRNIICNKHVIPYSVENTHISTLEATVNTIMLLTARGSPGTDGRTAYALAQQFASCVGSSSHRTGEKQLSKDMNY